MKRIPLFLLFCLGIALSARAQKSPPAAVAEAFKLKFPDAVEVEWEKEKPGGWEAEFEIKEQEISASFSADGKWLETETEIPTSELPQEVQSALAGKKIKEAARIQKADGSTVYEAEVKGKDLLFESTGKALN